MPDNTLVGVDLSFRNTGLVLAKPEHSDRGYDVVDCKNVRTEKASKKKALYVAQDDVLQAQLLYDGIRDFIEAHKPTAVVVELPTAGAKGARSNRCMGMATGVIAGIAKETDLPFIWILPEDSKVALAGKKNASKKEMIKAAKELWPKFGWPGSETNDEHIADACAALLVARNSDIYKFMRGRAED